MPLEPIALGGLLLVGLGILGAGLSVATTGIGRIRTARALGEAGPVALADVAAAEDLVEFGGTAREGDETRTGPLTGEPCLAYAVESRSRDPEAPTDEVDWTLEGRASAGVPFDVADGVDRVAVDPANAVLSLAGWEAGETDWTDHADLSDEARDRLASIGVGDVEADTDDRRQFRERRLEPGADVHVYGGTVRNAASGNGPVTVAGDDWFEIAAGDAIGREPSVFADRHRSGSLYVIFGGLLAVPGIGLTLAGIVGLVTTLLL